MHWTLQAVRAGGVYGTSLFKLRINTLVLCQRRVPRTWRRQGKSAFLEMAFPTPIHPTLGSICLPPVLCARMSVVGERGYGFCAVEFRQPPVYGRCQ